MSGLWGGTTSCSFYPGEQFIGRRAVNTHRPILHMARRCAPYWGRSGADGGPIQIDAADGPAVNTQVTTGVVMLGEHVLMRVAALGETHELCGVLSEANILVLGQEGPFR